MILVSFQVHKITYNDYFSTYGSFKSFLFWSTNSPLEKHLALAYCLDQISHFLKQQVAGLIPTRDT